MARPRSGAGGTARGEGGPFLVLANNHASERRAPDLPWRQLGLVEPFDAEPVPADRDTGAEALRQILGQAPVGVLVVAPDRVLYANDEVVRLLGSDPAEEGGALPRLDLLGADGARSDFSSVCAGLLAGRATLPVYELVGLSAEGFRRQLEVRLFLTRWNGSDVVCAMMTDVTARRNADTLALSELAKLAHFDRICTLGQMSATIAHEIAQPLAALSIAGGAVRRLLSQPVAKLDGALRAAEAIDAETRRMRDTVERIKEFASPNAHGAHEDREMVDVGDAVERAFRLTAPAFLAAGVVRDVQYEADASVRQVLGNQVQLDQMIDTELRESRRG